MAKPVLVLLVVLMSCSSAWASSNEDKIQVLRQKAEQGDSAAQFSLGVIFDKGKGVSEDNLEAVKWYRKSAEQGNGTAQFSLGLMYFDGTGLEQDYSEAVKWFGRAAEQGYAEAQLHLGGCFYHGRGVKQDYVEAAKWYRLSAEREYALGQYALGVLYASGRGVKLDYPEAVKLLRKAAGQGLAVAQNGLGNMYYKGDGLAQDYDEALKWFRMSAEQGDPGGQFSLGLMYLDGTAVPPDDSEAARWILKSAEQGSPNAQYVMGLMYLRGRGVSQNNIDSVRWLRRAAEQGHTEAKSELSAILLEIETVPSRATFTVFLGYEYVYEGVTPFQGVGIPPATYRLCFEKDGHELFWKTVMVADKSAAPVSANLRASQPQRESSGCRQENEKIRSERIAEMSREVSRLKALMNSTRSTTVAKKRGTGRYVTAPLTGDSFEIAETYLETVRTSDFTEADQEKLTELLKEAEENAAIENQRDQIAAVSRSWRLGDASQ